MKLISILILQVLLINHSNSQKQIHPRGLVTPEEALEIMQKVSESPYDQMVANVIKKTEELGQQRDNIYALSELTKLQAFLYLATGKVDHATEAYNNFTTLAADEEFVLDPFSKGLTRAFVLREMTYAYDFCFNAWSEDQKRFANNAIYDLMSSVNNNMGRMANYHIESNWMGVRYGSVAFAANVIDEEYLDQSTIPKKINPFKWDSKYRLQDHINAAFTDQGWFVETLGYHVYDWTFVAPALIAMQNSTSSDAFDLEKFVPNQLNSLDQHITATLSIQNGSAPGIKPDLGDDNLNMGLSHFAFGVRLMPEDKRQILKWMVEYLKRPEFYQDDFLNMALIPMDLESEPPGEEYLNYVDTIVGVTMFRNRFQDENDIVACFNTTAKRFPGHGGPDNLTFRIMGLSGIWAIGAGRTGEVVGQTNLFPATDLQSKKVKGLESEFLDYSFDSGSGYASGRGNCMGVEDHTRTFMADYSNKHGAEALFVVKDESADGKRWRLNTPEFNEVQILKNGFLITAPNGSSLKATAHGQDEVKVRISRVRYGGPTVANNPGIGYQGNQYADNQAIDIMCDGNITVVMTLQPAGKRHPKIEEKYMVELMNQLK